MIEGQDLVDGLFFSDGANGDVQFIKAPNVDQPRFLTPTKDSQVMPIIHIVPSWLSNSINKKRNL